MKKALAMIALAAICFGTAASAHTTPRMQQDTSKAKVKVKKKGNKVKVKKKMKDTTTHNR